MTTSKVKEKIDRLVAIEEFNSRLVKENIEFSRLPYWVQQSIEGDYMADGSDLQPYEPEEES